MISVALAHLKGWTAKTCKTIKVISREVGEQGDYSLYGVAAYYRGHTIIYAILRSIYFILFRLDILRSFQYFKGYFFISYK